ncbi:unnamed protein product [Citrullus colocynthis]|uniref:Uncharacterized protein n=1 Tax=Citrullus colocynthis TaxID=252529 RepID=A0ABP0YDZ2_9ROSI
MHFIQEKFMRNPIRFLIEYRSLIKKVEIGFFCLVYFPLIFLIGPVLKQEIGIFLQESPITSLLNDLLCGIHFGGVKNAGFSVGQKWRKLFFWFSKPKGFGGIWKAFGIGKPSND